MRETATYRDDVGEDFTDDAPRVKSAPGRPGAASADPAFARPNRRERFALALAVFVGVALFLVTLWEAVVSGRGDAQVFFRAGWAIWAGQPLYQITDHHGWSYLYPPPFAILMEPFADPAPGFPKPVWAAPFALSVALWCGIGVAAVVGATHRLANAVARFGGALPGGAAVTPYWALRLAPPFALILFFGAGWLRGQPTAILILLIVLFLTCLADRRPVAASLLLAVAITIKMFPVAFLLIPFLRRDVRVLVYTGAFALVFLFVFPAALVGVHESVELYRAFWVERLQGMVTGQLNPRIAEELSPWSIQVVSVGSMLARVFAAPLPEAPYRLPAWAQVCQLAFDLAVPFAVAAFGHGRFWRLTGAQPRSPYPIFVAGAVLFASLPAMLPVARPHYWAMAMPLVAVLFAEGWRRAGSPKPSTAQIVWLASASLAFVVTGPDAPGILSRLGATTPVMLALVVRGLWALRALPVAAVCRRATPARS